MTMNLKFCFSYDSSRQAHDVNITSPQRRCNVMTATLYLRCIDVEATLYLRHVPAGHRKTSDDTQEMP